MWGSHLASNRELTFPNVEGLPACLTCVPTFIAFKQGRAVVPHGHHNMVSMHMLLAGEVHARHYERWGGDDMHMVIESSLDKTFARGELSTVSDERNNIHWFKATRGPAFMFNVAVEDLNGTKNFSGRDYIDPFGGRQFDDGRIRAHRLTHTPRRSGSTATLRKTENHKHSWRRRPHVQLDEGRVDELIQALAAAFAILIC